VYYLPRAASAADQQLMKRIDALNLAHPFAGSRMLRDMLHRAGPAKPNSPPRVDTAPEGEDIARENWSKHEQKTPPRALSGIQGQGGAGRRTRRQDAGRTGATACLCRCPCGSRRWS